MNDQLDEQITQSLHAWADHATLRGPAFSDVRRRVRRRRRRHVATAASPVLLGAVWLGMRSTSGDSTVEPASPTTETGAAPEMSIYETSTIAEPTVPPTDFSTTTLVAGGAGALNPQLGPVICLDASGGRPDGAMGSCQATFGVGPTLIAGALSDHSFVMALDPKWSEDATSAATLMGLAVEPLQTPPLNGVNLAGSPVRVVIVIGQTNPPCTVPECSAATTTTTTAASSGGTYTVVPGDYLSLLAVKFGTTVNDIVGLNGWTDGTRHVLRVGDVILVPAAVQHGDVATTTTFIG